MATVSNVNLSVQHGGPGSTRTVTVSYRLCFTACEVLAGSVFVEKVLLRGDDPIWDDNLIYLKNACVRAEKECVDRLITQSVARSTLDEDPDTVVIVFGVTLFKWADLDELYARITLTPFTPTGASADSNIVTGQWGAAGND